MPARRRRVSTTRRRRTTRAKYSRGKYNITVYKKGAGGRYHVADKYYSDTLPPLPPPANTKISIKEKNVEYDSTSRPGAKYHIKIYDENKKLRDDYWDKVKPPLSVIGPGETLKVQEISKY